MSTTQNLTLDQGADLVFGIVYTANLPANTWTAATDYVTGEYVLPTESTGFVYSPVANGLSGATEPTWPTTLAETVADGDITWTCTSPAVAPVDLTGFNAYMTIAQAQTQVSSSNQAQASISTTANAQGVIVLGGSAGTISVTVYGSTTLEFEGSPLYYDLFVVNPTGPSSTMVSRGKITMNPNVTVPTY